MIKPRFKALFYGLLIFIFSSCEKVEKNMDDYFPVVKTVSASVQNNGDVIVMGELLSEGSTPVEYAGFCMNLLGDPVLADDQVIAYTRNGSLFSCTYSGFDPYKRYYFRTWAANDKGYVYGNTIFLDSIQATPVVPPCNPVMNTWNIGGGTFTETVATVSAPVHMIDTWDFSVNTNDGNYHFSFGSKPATGVYTTTDFGPGGPMYVYMYFSSGFISGSLKPGGKIYVNQTTVNHWEITLCNVAWQYNGGTTFYMNSKFDCPK